MQVLAFLFRAIPAAFIFVSDAIAVLIVLSVACMYLFPELERE